MQLIDCIALPLVRRKIKRFGIRITSSSSGMTQLEHPKKNPANGIVTKLKKMDCEKKKNMIYNKTLENIARMAKSCTKNLISCRGVKLFLLKDVTITTVATTTVAITTVTTSIFEFCKNLSFVTI